MYERGIALHVSEIDRMTKIGQKSLKQLIFYTIPKHTVQYKTKIGKVRTTITIYFSSGCYTRLPTNRERTSGFNSLLAPPGQKGKMNV